jgi:hypothetical protein
LRLTIDVDYGPAPVCSPGGLLGVGQTLEGDFEQNGLTTECSWGIEPVFASALSGLRRMALVAQR